MANALSSSRRPLVCREPIAPTAATPAAATKNKQRTGRSRDDADVRSGFAMTNIRLISQTPSYVSTQERTRLSMFFALSCRVSVRSLGAPGGRALPNFIAAARPVAAAG